MGNFVSPKSDVMFKRVFANPMDVAPLRSFLSSVLNVPGEDLVTLTLTDTHLHPVHSSDKESVVDVRVRTASGRDINVEIQLAVTPGFRERLVYYAAKMLATQLHSAQSYDALAQVITVAVTDFSLIEDGGYHHRFHLYDREHDVELTDVLELDVLELPKQPTSSDDTLLWKWMRFFTARNREELNMAATLDPAIADAAVKVSFFSEEETLQIIQQQEEKRERDEFNRALYQQRLEEEWARRLEETKRSIEEGNRSVEEINRRAEEGIRSVEEINRRAEEGIRSVEEINRHVEEGIRSVEEANRRADEANRHAEEASRYADEVSRRIGEVDRRVRELARVAEELNRHVQPQDGSSESSDQRARELDRAVEELTRGSEEIKEQERLIQATLTQAESARLMAAEAERQLKEATSEAGS